MLIGLAGNIGVGKDTIGEILVNSHGFKRTSFAKELKNLAEDLFKFDDKTLWGASEFRNAIDPRAQEDTYWDQVVLRVGNYPFKPLFPVDTSENPRTKLFRMIHEDFIVNKSSFSARYVLQRLGTEWGRTLWPDVWLHAVKMEIERSPGNWVITDCRFKNEAQFIIAGLSGSVVWIDASGRVQKKDEHKHASEPTRADLEPWVTTGLDNNGGMEELAGKVADVLKTIKA